jgi:predicted HD phosphohydrolase
MSDKVKKLIELYKKRGDTEYYGEKMTKTKHMLQCATLALKNEENEEIILACLLHDIGHFLADDDMDGYGVKDHGKLASEYLKNIGVSKNIYKLIEKHTDVKRYLVTKNINNYYNKLSEASKKTFEIQGGRMSKEELKLMDKNIKLADMIKVRIYDDKSKIRNRDPYQMEKFIPFLEKHIK